MRINGFSGTNTQTGTMGMTQGNDSVSKNIQNQIANAKITGNLFTFAGKRCNMVRRN